MPHITIGRFLIGSIIIAITSLIGYNALDPSPTIEQNDIYLEPYQGSFPVDGDFTITVKVRATEPVNVFSGLVTFDPDILEVKAINYNTGLADLWAVLPWYSNGEGTVNFAGGTTRGGFVGDESLLEITFRPKGAGNTNLALSEMRLLRHNGLGTDVSLNDRPIDSFIEIYPEVPDSIVAIKNKAKENKSVIITTNQSLDLNGDGMNNFTDISIFMSHLVNQDLRADFDGSGSIDLRDLNLLLSQR